MCVHPQKFFSLSVVHCLHTALLIYPQEKSIGFHNDVMHADLPSLTHQRAWSKVLTPRGEYVFVPTVIKLVCSANGLRRISQHLLLHVWGHASNSNPPPPPPPGLAVESPAFSLTPLGSSVHAQLQGGKGGIPS